MNSTLRRQALALLAALTLMLLATHLVFTRQRPSLMPAAATAAPVLPNPVIYPMSQELYTANGKQWIRYRYGVLNYDSYPNELFAASPDLPPCGKNTKSSRTWVDIYDQSGKRIYGFCAFGKNSDLNDIWFAVEQGQIPPSYIYIELNDRKTNTKYKSNLAETVL